MSLIDWINMNLFFDIFSVVFILFLLYKNKKLANNQSQIKNKQQQLDKLLYETIRNPLAAKRRLKKRQ